MNKKHFEKLLFLFKKILKFLEMLLVVSYYIVMNTSLKSKVRV